MTAAELVRASKAILLDFDGPVCGVFAGRPASAVASQLRRLLADRGLGPMAEFAPNRDPLKLLSWIGEHHPQHAGAVDDALTAEETRAVESAKPTAHADVVIKAAVRTGRPVAIVSNNSGAAISRYLALHGLADEIALIVGRAYADPGRLKPHPWAVEQAVQGLDVRADDCVLIGDSVADMQASRVAGVRAIGFSKGDFRGPALTEAGAEAVIDDMGTVEAALEQT
ncbi:HAD family hydrolase [Actinopolymorpha alba]|uniref:HAD family hydrolase n=1 Tax=Actinopolymorpha alba TaxID=533267 RepID=UPI0003764BC1|nr:HAD-IA family hydrolase [Actinopolymorpha alba]